MKTVVTALLFCCALPLSHASDSNNAYAVRGAGLATCEIFLQEREKKSNVYFMIGGWLDGYVSGVNRYAPDTYDALSFESTELVAGLLANHCKSHPSDRLFAIVSALLARLHEDRLRGPSPRVNGKVGEEQFTIYAEVLLRVQRRLAELGHYKGDPEPEFGDRTREALASYQTRSNLNATGLPDQGTLWLLLRQPGAGK